MLQALQGPCDGLLLLGEGWVVGLVVEGGIDGLALIVEALVEDALLRGEALLLLERETLAESLL